VLDHHDVEEIVRSSLGPASGLFVSRSVETDGYLTLTIRASSSTHTPNRTDGARAQIKTNGVDTFVLALDDQFEYRDVDWVPEGQRQILTLLTRLAEAYLAGSGRAGVKRGFFGGRYSELTVGLDRETYLFRGKRL
jgi:hypothetical protein